MTEAFAIKNSVWEDDEVQLLTFHVHDQVLGIPVLQIRDVFLAQKITPVPLASQETRGLINLRGRIVTALSMREKLNFPKVEAGQKQMIIAIEHAGEVYGLLVDKVGEVITLAQDLYEKKPQVLDGKLREIAKGVFKLEGKLLILLDVDRIIQTCQDNI
ncbi:Chemotaxis protein CheW [Candidatus Bealeia paramacronuclearis]|uniref:Chemotaxis protein CheW n=1 Tax=Candidatus Bealeia paramacronuclearis TaxID=1921001 RepID=A0ABZ2C2D0_9PROT|nr:Chemotaxis protein CheW [Candidatus Bealeia paramacronuclearis]